MGSGPHREIIENFSLLLWCFFVVFQAGLLSNRDQYVGSRTNVLV